jgi:hypothetical protein
VLDDDLGLEVEAAGVAEVLVVGPGEAVDAPVLAAAVGVDGPVEGDVAGRRDVVDDRAGVIGDQLDRDVGRGAGVGGRGEQHRRCRHGRISVGARAAVVLEVAGEPLEALPLALLAEHVEADLFKAVAGVDARAAPPGGAGHESVTFFGVAGLHGATVYTNRAGAQREPPRVS